MNNFTKRVLSTTILLPLVFYIIISGSYLLIFFNIFVFLLAIYEWNAMSKNKKYKIFGFLFLIFSFFCFYKISRDLVEVFFVILVCVSTDIGGYIFGKIFKGPRLTKISPNKTYAGMIGSYVLSLTSVLTISNFIDYYAPTIIIIFLIIMISTISQLGDIIVSYFKRLAHIKNSGNIIPGHGGLLDRIDGMIFAFPIYFSFDLINNITL